MKNRFNQLKADASKLLNKAETMCPFSLVNDPGAGVNADAKALEKPRSRA